MITGPVSYLNIYQSGKEIILAVIENKNCLMNKKYFKSALQHSSLIPSTKIIGVIHLSHTQDLRQTPLT